ncbi:MAG: sulfotransferase, partial [Phycisphaerae bacterium]
SEIATIGELNAVGLPRKEGYCCSCGIRLEECGFWRALGDAMARRGHSLSATDLHSISSAYVSRLISPLHRGPRLERLRDAALTLSPTWRRAFPLVAARNVALVQAVCEVTGKRMVVDSSKVALRLKYLLREPALDVRVLRLVRDGRGVSLTYMRPYHFADSADPSRRAGGRGVNYDRLYMTARRAARLWRRSNEDAEMLLRGLPRQQWLDLRYEDLCTRPAETLRRIYAFLEVNPDGGTLDYRSRPHHVIGNGMRLDPSSEIRLDERWRTVLTARELRAFDRVAGPMNRGYGYA